MTLLKDLARAKITFQARTLRTILTEGMNMSDQSKHDQMSAARELVNRLLGYQLRTGYDVQTGVDTNAPSVVWADADYEVGDGTCGLHETQKPANEPAIPYVRFDALTAALDENERLNAAIKRQAGAAKTLRELTLAEVQHIRDAERKEYIATQTLDSEREANAILTEENATLRTEKHADAEAIGALREALQEVVGHCRNTGRGSDMVNDRIIERCEDTAMQALKGDTP